MDWFEENPQEIMGCSYHISTATRELVITRFEKSQEATLRFLQPKSDLVSWRFLRGKPILQPCRKGSRPTRKMQTKSM
jgi:hypothetical protein